MVGCADLVAYRTLCERDQLEQQCTHLLWLAITVAGNLHPAE